VPQATTLTVVAVQVHTECQIEGSSGRGEVTFVWSEGTAMSPSWTDLITGILWVLFVRVLPILAVLVAVSAVIYLLVYRLPRALLRRREGTKDTD